MFEYKSIGSILFLTLSSARKQKTGHLALLFLLRNSKAQKRCATQELFMVLSGSV